MSSDEKTGPLHTRGMLPDLFYENGLPRPSLSYLHKLACLGEGPPVASFWGNRPLYDPAASVAWFKDRLAKKSKAARERREQNLQARLERLQRLQKQAIAALEKRVA